LKKKWTETHKKFEEEGHISLIDTVGLKERRLANEAKLQQIERDIKSLMY
jgi:hypothetical protein